MPTRRVRRAATLGASVSALAVLLGAGPVLAADGPGPTPGRSAPAIGGWRWPLPGPATVGRRFDRPPGPYAAGHRGVDLTAPAGTPVLAAADGVVAFAGSVAGRGVVSVRHGALRSTYEPVLPAVRAGQRVRAGQVLATLAAGNHCPLPCLHWGVLRGQVYLDPLSVLTGGPVRLLPLGDAPAYRAGTTGRRPPLDTARPYRTGSRAASPLAAAGRRRPTPTTAAPSAPHRPRSPATGTAAAGVAGVALAAAALLRRRRGPN